MPFFSAIVQKRCEALAVFPDTAMYEPCDRIATDAKLPSLSGWSPAAEKRLLPTYGRDVRVPLEPYRSHSR